MNGPSQQIGSVIENLHTHTHTHTHICLHLYLFLSSYVLQGILHLRKDLYQSYQVLPNNKIGMTSQSVF